MGRREGLVKVDVHGIDPQIAGPDPADDGIKVGAVAVKEGALRMSCLGNRDDLVFEQTAGVGVRYHHRRHIRPQSFL